MRRRGGRRACQPHAVSGAEVAARARAAYAAKHGGYTGAIGKKKASQARSFAPIAYSDDRSDRGLPLAQPGADGED
jgi:hypothetical protein